jgi:hypothetical protein
MALPVPSGNPQTILVTSAAVNFNGVDVGLVSGVKVSVKHETTEVKTDQAGKSIVNHFYVGDSVSIEMMFDEYTAAKMAKAYPYAKLIGTSPQRVNWGQQVGQDFYSKAYPLIIQPTSDDTGSLLRRFYFYKAAPIGDSQFEYGPDKKIQIKTVFHCYPDFTQVPGQFYGFFGDTAAGTLTGATGGPAVAGANTGNGTVSGIVVNNNFTKTETWTLTCIAAIVNSGLFSVVGSVTGSRGVATVGSTFTSNTITPANSELQFLINDGATDFVAGDTFTIPTVAANYT